MNDPNPENEDEDEDDDVELKDDIVESLSRHAVVVVVLGCD